MGYNHEIADYLYETLVKHNLSNLVYPKTIDEFIPYYYKGQTDFSGGATANAFFLLNKKDGYKFWNLASNFVGYNETDRYGILYTSHHLHNSKSKNIKNKPLIDELNKELEKVDEFIEYFIFAFGYSTYSSYYNSMNMIANVDCVVTLYRVVINKLDLDIPDHIKKMLYYVEFNEKEDYIKRFDLLFNETDTKTHEDIKTTSNVINVLKYEHK